jgi:hypothetical protein
MWEHIQGTSLEKSGMAKQIPSFKRLGTGSRHQTSQTKEKTTKSNS